MAGFAVLFQVPLLILFINRIKPLTPRKMIGAQRYIIVGSFIIAAVVTPTPDPFNQTLMAAPLIVLYQVGIVLVYLVNRKGKSSRTQPVIQKITEVKEKAVEEKIIPPVITPRPRSRPVIITDVVPASRPLLSPLQRPSYLNQINRSYVE